MSPARRFPPPWSLLALLLALPLAGCYSDQKQQVAACKLEAMRLYPGDAPSFKIGDYIQTCMETHAYEINVPQSSCVVTDNYKYDPGCYAPVSWVGRHLYNLETGSNAHD
jgi:hypothetical protein